MTLKTWTRITVIATCTVGIIGCVADPYELDEELGTITQPIPAPLPSAYCEINVNGKNIPTETDYIPHVVQCENGGANIEALKAQAIAARSVAYYSMAKGGTICDGQSCQVYSCSRTPTEKHKQAAEETAGIYLSYDNMLTYAFYVAGDPNVAPPSCKGSSGSTEHYVTYNEGKTGVNVQQTTLGWVGDPGFGQNRGCMSQNAAKCLENHRGYDYKQILKFFYGDDILMLTAPGSCVKPVQPALDASLVASGSNATAKGANTYEVCTGQSFNFWFEVQNTGTATWTDSSGSTEGSAVRLGASGNATDPLTGEARISINDTKNNTVVPDGPDCSNAPGCKKTRFKGDNGIDATAPSTPGTVVTKWRLVDEGRKWFGPEMSLTFLVKQCDPGTGGSAGAGGSSGGAGSGGDGEAGSGGSAGEEQNGRTGGRGGDAGSKDAGSDASDNDWDDNDWDNSQEGDGCSCRLAPRSLSTTSVYFTFGALALAATIARRRRVHH